MERYRPKATCCGVPIVWKRCSYGQDEVWEGMCVWCKREFTYTNATGRVRT